MSFKPRMSFDAPAGWRFSPSRDFGWFLWPGPDIPDEDLPLNIAVFRFEAKLAEHGCENPAELRTVSKASELIDWLKTLDGIDATIKERSVGDASAWEVDLTVERPPVCGGSRSDHLAMWSLSQAVGYLALAKGDRYRFYLIQAPDEIVLMAVQFWGLTNPQPFIDAAEGVFGSLALDTTGSAS